MANLLTRAVRKVQIARLHFVLWIADDEIRRLKYEVEDWRHLAERLQRAFEIAQAERDGYKRLVDRFTELQAEALSLRPIHPIIVPKEPR